MQDQWLNDCCQNNSDFIKNKIRAVVLLFHGLGGGVCKSLLQYELALAEQDILTIEPYHGPWCWMNRQARLFVDEIVERTWREFKLDESTRLFSTGLSMGGLAALLYCRYGKRPPVGCDVLYPVCDAVYHYRERPDVSTSMNAAFYGYSEPFETVLEEHSPLHQIEAMPDIPYQFIHGNNDQAVNILHSDKMVAALREKGCQVEYLTIDGMGHGINVPLSVWQKRVDFITARV